MRFIKKSVLTLVWLGLSVLLVYKIFQDPLNSGFAIGCLALAAFMCYSHVIGDFDDPDDRREWGRHHD